LERPMFHTRQFQPFVESTDSVCDDHVQAILAAAAAAETMRRRPPVAALINIGGHGMARCVTRRRRPMKHGDQSVCRLRLVLADGDALRSGTNPLAHFHIGIGHDVLLACR